MSHPAIAIANAVVVVIAAGVSGGQISASLSPVRAYRPVAELAEQGTSCLVIPGEPVITFRDRGHLQWDQPIAVVIQKKFTNATYTNALIDPIVTAAEEVAEYLRDTLLSNAGDAKLISLVHDPVFVPEHLDKFNQITTVVTATYRVTGEST